MPVLEYGDVGDAKRDLTAAGFTAFVADPAAAVDYRNVGYEHRKVAIVVGSEGGGVSAEWRTPDLTRVSIPMRSCGEPQRRRVRLDPAVRRGRQNGLVAPFR